MPKKLLASTLLVTALGASHPNGTHIKATSLVQAAGTLTPIKPRTLDLVTHLVDLQEIILGYLNVWKDYRTFTHDDLILAMAGSPDGRYLATAGKDKNIYIWDVVAQKLIQKLTGHSDCVSALAFSPNAKQLASGSWDHILKIWDMQTYQLVYSPKEHLQSGYNSLAYSPDGKQLATSAGGAVKFWYTDTYKKARKLETKETSCPSPDICFSKDGTYVAVTLYPHKVQLWDAKKNKLVKTITGEEASAVTFSPDGKYLVVGFRDEIQFYDMKNFACCHTISLSDCEILCYSMTLMYKVSLAFSPNGTLFAYCQYTPEMKLVDMETFKRLATIAVPRDFNHRLSFSPNGHDIAGIRGSQVIIWSNTAQIIRNADAQK